MKPDLVIKFLQELDAYVDAAVALRISSHLSEDHGLASWIGEQRERELNAVVKEAYSDMQVAALRVFGVETGS